MADVIVSACERLPFDYSTPRKCRKCGVLFSGRGCKDCKNASKRARRAENPEKARAAAAKLRAKDREKRRQAAIEYRLRDPDAVRRAKRKYRDKNKTPEQIALTERRAAIVRMRTEDPEWAKKTATQKRRERARSYRARFPDRVRAQLAAWVKANPGYNRVKVQNRRARRIAAGGKLSKGLAEKLLDLQKGRCACCGRKLGRSYHLDHIQPLSRGGTNDDWNIQLLRSECNLEKHASDPLEFMQQRGFLL